MYDIPELERKWKRYKRNKIKKPIILTLSFVIVGAGAYVAFLKYTQSKKEVIKEAKNTPLAPKKETNQTPPPPLKKEEKAIIITKTPINPTPVAPTPASKVVKSSEPEIDLSKATIVKPDVPEDEIRVIGFDDKDKEKKEVLDKYKNIIPANVPITPKVDPIVQEYEDRFKESQDPQDALYLAKYFYKKKNYPKAEIWAANANNIDGEIEDSWIIFAKAKAKQGHRVEAIKILQEYYDSTASLKAKELLDKLRRNKPF